MYLMILQVSHWLCMKEMPLSNHMSHVPSGMNNDLLLWCLAYWWCAWTVGVASGLLVGATFFSSTITWQIAYKRDIRIVGMVLAWPSGGLLGWRLGYLAYGHIVWPTSWVFGLLLVHMAYSWSARTRDSRHSPLMGQVAHHWLDDRLGAWRIDCGPLTGCMELGYRVWTNDRVWAPLAEHKAKWHVAWTTGSLRDLIAWCMD